ncbi:unnamed protein product [Ostreobium quekettii]|uniref:Chromosome transmission fidelity protein 8 n=1 Tax=Ostreobium quekettii TaxID=121088 RepID=A0A8S1ITQ8_9CHLO|nr:unnamed protein product [Ostreobium quekettii]
MIVRIEGTGGREEAWAMLDLQGKVIRRDDQPVDGSLIGDLTQSPEDPMLVDLRIAGMYKLSGKKEKLKRPFVVMQKNTEHVVKEGATSYKVLGVVRWRIKFYSEPDLIIRRSETGEEL